jgi:L-rhamnonate dehydratase
MEISDIYTVSVEVPDPDVEAEPRREPWYEGTRVANPLSGYPRYADDRSEWRPSFERFGCIVESGDGTRGFATGVHGAPVASLVDDHLGPRLVGENPMAIEKIYDMATRMCEPLGKSGITAFAVSAIDRALWDLKGKHLDVPVYELLGGPAREELTCYATGNDTDWYAELGFEATKLACPYGPADGEAGVRKNAELVAEARETMGPDAEVMLDCWMAFDEAYTVRLANELREHDVAWIEEALPPERIEAHAAVRERLPWATLATGEHWFTVERFQEAASRRLVDVFQPDVDWFGLTPVVKVAAIAEAAGIDLVPHAAGNSVYGQHVCYALPAIDRTEFFVGTAPGVPLEAGRWLPGQAVPEEGTMTPPDDPGFGVDMDRLKLTRPFAPDDREGPDLGSGGYGNE